MDVGLQHVAERCVHQPVPGQRQLAGEGGTDDVDAEMSLPATRAGMPRMLVAVVDDLDRGRVERLDQQGADALDPLRVEPRDIGLGPAAVHGSTRLNGRTSTRV